MKQSEWMRGLLKCESDIQTNDIRYAYDTLVEMECDWVAYRNELKRDTFKDFIKGTELVLNLRRNYEQSYIGFCCCKITKKRT